MNTNSEFFKKGHDLGSGGHAAGLAPQGMTSEQNKDFRDGYMVCLLYTSPSPRD